jgi:hypothetical protein
MATLNGYTQNGDSLRPFSIVTNRITVKDTTVLTNGVSVTSDQWGYVGNMDQNVNSASNVTFNAISGTSVNTTDETVSRTMTSTGILSLLGTGDKSGLPAATNAGIFISGNTGSPNAGQIFVGDGTGWRVSTARRVGGVTTEVINLYDGAGDNILGIFGTPVIQCSSGSFAILNPTPGDWIFRSSSYKFRGTSGFEILDMTMSTGVFRFRDPANTSIVRITINSSAGSIVTTGNVTVGGNLVVTGSLSKGSGTFDIEHPTVEGKRLTHSFIEGPRCDLIYRGKVTLSAGTGQVDLDLESTSAAECAMTPGTFTALCHNAQYTLQNNTSFSRVRGQIEGSILTIWCEDKKSIDEIYWTVIAERKDPHIKAWDKTTPEGYLRTEYTPVETTA